MIASTWARKLGAGLALEPLKPFICRVCCHLKGCMEVDLENHDYRKLSFFTPNSPIKILIQKLHLQIWNGKLILVVMITERN